MSAAMDQFARVAHSPGDWLKGWKAKSGKKVIGGFPLYVPEELIHAAGMLPVVLQGSDKPITRAAEYLHSNVCHPVQGNFDQALRGEMDYVDGLVFADVCEQAKRAASLWQLYHTVPYRFNILFPHILNSQAASSYMVKELGRFNVNVNSIAPGMVLTDMMKKIPMEFQAKALEETVVGRFATPEDVAHLVTFLCSDLSRHITGEVIKIDGGQYM